MTTAAAIDNHRRLQDKPDTSHNDLTPNRIAPNVVMAAISTRPPAPLAATPENSAM